VRAAIATPAPTTTARGPIGLPRFDAQLVVYAALLVGIGIVMGHSAAFGSPPPADGPPQPAKTVIWAAIGFTLFAVVARTDYRWLRRMAVPVYATVIALLVITRAFGSASFGAQMSVSVLGLDFQFSEIGKVLMVAVLAAFLAERRERVRHPSTILIAAVLVSVPAALVLAQPDLGTAVVFAAIGVGMLFLAGASVPWLIGLLVLGAAAAPVAVGMLRDYQRDRLLCFLDPGVDPRGACYQVVQSLDAVAAGGLLGRGLSVGGEDAAGRVPVQTTDFIFSVIAEDLGFAGGAVVLLLFGLLLWRILVIGWRAADPYAALIAGGLATIILFQVTVNVGMVLGVMPVTGVPLPFITYGGSSLISLLVGLGIVESVRARSARPDS
jgi:rod shape determining protein RodA